MLLSKELLMGAQFGVSYRKFEKKTEQLSSFNNNPELSFDAQRGSASHKAGFFWRWAELIKGAKRINLNVFLMIRTIAPKVHWQR
jgi:hypothetical protein